jgi:CAAX protease family protein
MTSDQTTHHAQQTLTPAHVWPLAVFLACLMVPDLLPLLGSDASQPNQPWYVTTPEHWLYPVQTLLTLGVLFHFRNSYQFRPIQGLFLAAAVGMVGIAFWIAPGFLFQRFGMPDGSWRYLGFAERTDGFDPGFIATHSHFLYWCAIVMRFVRLVVVVPLAEEIFWRGFLMRYIVDMDGDYWKVPFGTFHFRSFVAVTTLFMAAHATIDYVPAVIFGSMMYWLAVRTKSLAACVMAHAVANLTLGVYVMTWEQWGYW